jgi:small subunit ribosomal protein S17
MAETEQSTAKPRKTRRTVVGVVTSAHKTPKTLRVEVRWLSKHSKYGKIVGERTRVHAHDEKAEAHLGDVVELMECRPVSKTKTWRLVRIVRQGPRE